MTGYTEVGVRTLRSALPPQRLPRPDFEALQARLRPRNGKLTSHLCYMVFDCLYVNDRSLLNRSLEERQAVLWEMQPVLQCDEVKLTEGFDASKSKRLKSKRLMKACAFMGLEGVVMKRKGSTYQPDFRSPDWIKVPIRHREEREPWRNPGPSMPRLPQPMGSGLWFNLPEATALIRGLNPKEPYC